MSGTTTPSVLDEVKSWANSIVPVLASAVQAYEEHEGTNANALVASLMSALQQANGALQQATDASTVKDIILDVLKFAEKIEPLVVAFLPAPVAAALPIGLSLLEAIVGGLPFNASLPYRTEAKKTLDAHAAAVAHA